MHETGFILTNGYGVNEVRKGQAHLLDLLIDHMRSAAQNVLEIFLSIRSNNFLYTELVFTSDEVQR